MKKSVTAALGLLLFGLLMLWLRNEPESQVKLQQVKTAPYERNEASPGQNQRDIIEVAPVEKPLPEEPPTALPPVPKGAIRGEMTLTYPDAASAEAARQRLLDAGFEIIGINRALNTLRVRVRGTDERRRLAALAGSEAQPGYNFPVTTPTPPATKIGGGSQPFGPKAVEWMGGSADKKYGLGVKVAVVDSGTTGHGLSVASLVAGEDTGIAPAAEVLSIQVFDESGKSNAFDVAEGIVKAIDAGARVINLSLGTYGDAAVLQAAIDYAQSNGAIVVAAAGNDAAGQVTFPAAYEGVVGVASVDAAGQTATFSNYGEGIDVAAPGVGVSALDGDEVFGADSLILFSGTSASAPLVSGALAALLSENPGMSNEQAVDILLSTANDSGPPGEDPYLGTGSANLARMLEYAQPGVQDIAIADHYLVEGNAESVSVLVNVQNRGTQWTGNLDLEVQFEGRSQVFRIGGLNPGETVSQEILLNPTLLLNGQGTLIQSRVSGGGEDVRPDDNTKATRITLQPKTPE